MLGLIFSGATVILFLGFMILAMVTDVLRVIWFGLASLALLAARAWLRHRAARNTE